VISINGTMQICESSFTQLLASGATTYSWLPTTGLSDPSINNPQASPSSTTDYTVTGLIGQCSSDTVITLIVHPLPVADIQSTPFDCKIGSQLTASGGVNYSWAPTLGLDLTNIATPFAHPRNNTTYTVTVTDSFACVSTATIFIPEDCDSLFIPNGISPDDDGVNDYFVIQGLQNFPNNSIQIFNRWGTFVFKSKPYNNNWDGTCKEKWVVDGEKLPEGTYYYILEMGEGLPGKTGYIELRR